LLIPQSSGSWPYRKWDFWEDGETPALSIRRRFLARASCSKIKPTSSVNLDIESGIVAMFGGGRLEDQLLAMLRGQLTDIVFGAVFLFIGLAVCFIAAIRPRSGVRLVIWLGIWSAMYGTGLLFRSPAVVAALPRVLQTSVPYVNTLIAYLLAVFAMSAFLELSRGGIGPLIKILILAQLVVAVVGFGWFAAGGSADKFIVYHRLVSDCGLLVLITVVTVKKLSDKFLVLSNRRVLATGTLVLAIEALWSNVLRPLHYQQSGLSSHLAFAVFLLSFGYVAVEIIHASEHRLQEIEDELKVARELQFSILPAAVPEVRNLRIAVAYRPMKAVAGDFYEFIPLDGERVGFLVADVTGHGVPAALIASMIKVAMQSVMSCAGEPGEVLRGLNRILYGLLRDQLVSAAYLLLDTGNGKALYSAAGHPPLLRWREGKLEGIESNGLLFGVIPEADYPVCDLSIHSGDRFVLYTDGVIEPQNANGDSFGDRKLEQVLRDNQSRTSSELSVQLLSEIRVWQSASVAQQDDITLLVIDVV
jgi:sigma-B regulation protein RsbU (phosphoserine phosphatase)